jgi:RND family efflux transporter MFP subunit
MRTFCFLGLSALVACDRGHDHAEPHPHDHGEEAKTAQVTVWGERYEVFMEHQAVVVNTPTRFITHVTDLQTLEPRRQGPVTFLLQYGAEGPIEHVAPEPARAGIYIPEIHLGKPGAWKMTLKVEESTIELGTVKVFESAEAAKNAEFPPAPEGVSFLKEQQWKVLSRMEPVRRRQLSERIRLPGVVASRPNSRAAVSSPLQGRLLAAPGKSMPGLGDRVEAGQVLAWVQPPFSELASRLVEAEANEIKARLTLEHAQLTLERMKKLVAENGRPERDLKEAEFAVRSAQADYQAAQALRAAYMNAGASFVGEQFAVELKSPISGVVTQVSAVVGEYVSSERALFAILDTSRVWIEVRVPESDLHRLSEAVGALYESPAEKGRFLPIGGDVVFHGLSVDAASRTVPIVYQVENPESRLKIGMTLSVQLETKRVEDAIAVPASAVVDEDGKPIAFVQLSGETFAKRELKLGLRDGSWVQVIDGLSDGDRVVTKEAYAIRLASVSNVIPAHGHAH